MIFDFCFLIGAVAGGLCGCYLTLLFRAYLFRKKKPEEYDR